MQKRTLGRSEIEIAPLVFGGNVFGWTVDERQSFELLDRFVERGFNTIDTADVYSNWAPGNSGGESESVMGSWLAKRGRRDDVVLMTKVGMWHKRKGLSAANITAAVEDSLKRLRTDYLDVYFAHIDDTDVALEETLEAFSKLVQDGKVRALGASNYDGERLRQALSISQEQQLARYEVVQPEYNLYDRQEYETGLAEVAEENEVGVVTYFSLASGFLSGKYRSKDDIADTARAGMLQKYFTPRGGQIMDALHELSKQLNATPAQLALAWLIGSPGVTAPIASATRIAQLEEIMDAAELTLPDEARRQLTEASAYETSST